MASDEQVEIRIRKDLKGVPGIVPIFVYEYLNEEGEYRKRFLSERCDGDIASLIFAKKKGTRGGLEPLPVGSRQTRKALRLLCDACSIFEQFHARHIAFLDLRLRSAKYAFWASMTNTPYWCAYKSSAVENM